MSRSDAYEDEVHSLRHISDEDADRLMRGDLPAGDPGLDELAAFVQDVGDAYSTPPTEPVQARHLDAMRRAARPRAAGWNPSAEPADAGSAPGRDGPGLPEWARRILAGLTPRPGLAGAAAALAVCLAFSTLTALGRLPEPVQAAVAGAARAVGVSVPDPHEERSPARRRPREHQRAEPAAPASVAAPQPAPAIGRRSVPPHGQPAPKTGGSATPNDGMSDLPTTTTPDPPAVTPPDEPGNDTPPEAPAEPAPAPEAGSNGDQSGAPSQSPLPIP
jgi:hypothetical protein